MPRLKTTSSGNSDAMKASTPVGLAQAETKIVLAALAESSVELADRIRKHGSNSITMAQFVALREAVSGARAAVEEAELALSLVDAKVWEV